MVGTVVAEVAAAVVSEEVASVFEVVAVFGSLVALFALADG